MTTQIQDHKFFREDKVLCRGSFCVSDAPQLGPDMPRVRHVLTLTDGMGISSDASLTVQIGVMKRLSRRYHVHFSDVIKATAKAVLGVDIPDPHECFHVHDWVAATLIERYMREHQRTPVGDLETKRTPVTKHHEQKRGVADADHCTIIQPMLPMETYQEHKRGAEEPDDSPTAVVGFVAGGVPTQKTEAFQEQKHSSEEEEHATKRGPAEGADIDQEIGEIDLLIENIENIDL